MRPQSTTLPVAAIACVVDRTAAFPPLRQARANTSTDPRHGPSAASTVVASPLRKSVQVDMFPRRTLWRMCV
ncbi:hypothetical protein PF005_g25797 [Phytophthora fragariae]|uniref:Uncharacterized protein n=1 Tax=Phytophthora fragariae TaxID=53985 RepID=A0A6A3W0X3_9STRA|nr:hypothetical protein PF006_g25209 [Phytophthora fragariae]KAE9174586.1 hypothetical protein PF005_g25797 [Phytophthora fragariae]